MQSKVFRFPGGCWAEGDHFKQMNYWKKTTANIDTRIPSLNFWGYQFFQTNNEQFFKQQLLIFKTQVT